MTSILSSRTLLQVVLFAIVATFLGRGYLTHVRRRRMQREHGCLPLDKAKRVPQKFWIPGVGLQAIQNQLRMVREGNLLATLSQRSHTIGETYVNRMLFDDVVITSDPQNIKAVLALKFKDFGLAPTRAAPFRQLMGSGIFVTDGGEWTCL